MQILHLKTRIKRENSILTGHLTAVKVGVIYCSGGVTAVYCTTQVHPPVGEPRVLQCCTVCTVCSVSSPSRQTDVCISWPSDHHVPSQSHLFTAPSWVQPGHHLSYGLDWEPAVLARSPHTGWRSLEAGVGSRQPGVRAVVRPGHLPHTRGHHHPAVESQFGYKKFWLATSRVLSRLTSISGTRTGF